ncbi:hypothetical protein RvY_13009 [Ramazzottius varieornatus]|uniref:Uncharacterized protein n=1 Tax=Ramazzottius varieornatus TaxID=947166 RepID=A0A1D1VTZ0_RAMVA|nr:hypothetical protein RvY_13009 [Ramazzottius varieornatus]
MELAAINQHVEQLGMNQAGSRLDFFVQADETQLSCTNALRQETILKQERPERIKALNRTFANFRLVKERVEESRIERKTVYMQVGTKSSSCIFFRWDHRNKISTDRFEFAKYIGKPLRVSLKELKFPTTNTFNTLEVFKARLHSGHLRSDEELNTFVSVVREVHKNEKKRLEQIRRRNELTQGGHWFIKRRRWKPRDDRGFSRTGLMGLLKRSREVWDAVDFALRGCDPMFRQNLKIILKRKQLSRSSILNRREAILQLQQRGGDPSRRTISEATKVCQFETIRVDGTMLVPEPSIMCDICKKQKGSSVDEHVIPPFWITYLTRTGDLCGHPKCVRKTKVKTRNQEARQFPNRKKQPPSKNPVPTLPFPLYEKVRRVAKRTLKQTVLNAASNALEDHNIGIRGKTILTPESRNDPLGQPAEKIATPIEEAKENNVAPEGFLVNKRLTF